MPRCLISKKDENQISKLGGNILNEDKKYIVTKEVNQGLPKLREALQNIQNQNITKVLDTKKDAKPAKFENQLNDILKTKIDIQHDLLIKNIQKIMEPSDPLQYGEYIEQVYVYLRKREIKARVSEMFLDRQDEITEKMRWILVDWIVQVHYRFGLTQETLFICVNLIDRYIEKYLNIKRTELQLIGITCLLLASKYEEQCVPEMRDFVYVTDYSSTGAQIRDMEVKILNAVEFDVNSTICLHFLRRITKACNINQITHNIAKYFMELCLLDKWVCQFVPSFVAAACICLAIQHSGENIWNDHIEAISGYKKTNLLILIQRIPYIVCRNEELKLSAVHVKYQQKSYGAVSNMEFFKSPEFRNFYQPS